VWLQQDPYRGRLDVPGVLHRYGYVGSNPVNYVDVYGFDRTKSEQYHTGCGYTMSCLPSKMTGCGFTIDFSQYYCKEPDGRRVNPVTIYNQSSNGQGLDSYTMQYLGEPNGLLLDSFSLIAEEGTRAYWTYYPYMAANRITVVRTLPKLTIYSRTMPGVNGTAARGLATLETTGTIIPIKSPAWNSVSTPFALAGVGYDAYQQYNEDVNRADLDTLQKVGRVSVQVSASSTILATSIAVGTAIGGPIGFVAGAGVGILGQWAYEEYVEDKAFEALGFE
jgi:hypothetical protein